MKNFQNFALVILIISITGLLSCGTDKNPVISSTEFTIDKFPHEIGTVWVYEFIDRLNSTTDTLFVRINDTTRITDDSLLVYRIVSETQFLLNYDIDTTYWHISGDTVTYYKYEFENYRIDRTIIFPLEVGNNWETGTFPLDLNTVFEKNSKIVLGKTYSNAYQINRTGGAFNDYINDSYWCVPNIGLIQINENRISLGPLIDETWNLISFYEPDSFELSDFPLQVGASWNYKVVNNLLDCVNCYDSCIVTIIDSIMDRGGIIRENLLFNYPDQERVTEVAIDKNDVYFLWHHYAVHFRLEFPLYIGKRWNTETMVSYSSMQVIGKKTITTDADTFIDAFHLRGFTTDGFEPGAEFKVWIVKNIGIVKLTHQGSPVGSYEDKTWVLQSYSP